MPSRKSKVADDEQEDLFAPASPLTADAAANDADDDATTLAEGQIYDFITETPVQDTPLERTLQAVARSLVEEYGFDRSQLSRDQTITYQTTTEDGRPRKGRQKVSIAVYLADSDQDNSDDIIRVCVVQPPTIKASDKKRGITATLEDLLGILPRCDYGLWTNGTDLVFWQKLTGPHLLQPDYQDLYDMPGNGETAADLDSPDRQARRIATGDNLKLTFSRVHDYIYGNQGLKKDAAFWQVLNLIFCKIYDERTTRGQRRFWVKATERNAPEGQAAIARRIKTLFDEVKHSNTYASVFSESDKITLNDRVLAYVVGELSRYNLLDTDVDVKGAAYEEITASTLKAQRGQFFTPTNVIQLMVQMMDPGGAADLTNPAHWPRILDPACGSGRFLTYALDHMRRKIADQLFPDEHPLLRVRRLDEDEQSANLVRDYARQCIYGIDFDPDLQRASRMNMILNNDGHGNILSFNSLEYPTMLAQSLGETRAQYGKLPRAAVPDPVRARLDADLGTFDFVFTNPPFGAKIPIDDEQILQQFDLARRWLRDEQGRLIPGPNLQSKVAPEVLFVERCVKWVRPGTGRVAIVVPDGILGNPDAEYIRVWILQHCQVLASVDLPVEAFLPQVGVQASLLFLRRKSPAEMDAEALGHVPDYPVFMAIAENVGHDRRGNEIYKRDPDGAEIFFTRTYAVLQRQKNILVPVTVTRNEKQRDDDLPRIGEMYQHFVKTGEVPA